MESGLGVDKTQSQETVPDKWQSQQILSHIIFWAFLTTEPDFPILSILCLSGLCAFLHPLWSSVSFSFVEAYNGGERAEQWLRDYFPADL